MNTDTVLQVRTFGGFSIRLGDREINDSGTRSRKVWLLLAYMIYHRNRPVSHEELISLLWGEEESSSNPVSALKTVFHRLRSTLDQLNPSAGHRLIVWRNGNYTWNNEVPAVVDVEEFDKLHQMGAAKTEEEGLTDYLQALDLYHGDFLPKLSAEPWVVPIAAYYHNLYLQITQEVLAQLEIGNRREEAVSLCRRAVELEPYSEEIYQHLMRNLLCLGRQREAISAYETMSQLLFANFEVTPSDETQALYREAVRSIHDKTVSLDTLQDQLQEETPAAGAMICDYDFFKVLYRVQARSIARNGDAVHIGLLSVFGRDGKTLAKRSLDRAVENLQKQIFSSLRKGDIAARCSVSQFVLMLSQANFENSCMVCERIIKAFCRRYPHSPAEIRYSVQPLEPTM